jgi:hypothetical protein
MDARNLWRVRLILFIVTFLISMFIPSWYSTIGDGHSAILQFPWGSYYLGELSEYFSSSLSIEELVLNTIRFFLTAILPSVVLILGIRGCVLTHRCLIGKRNITKTARILTQISVTASLFPAISTGIYSLLYAVYSGIYLLLNISGSYISIGISGFCILPLAVFLAYISYDFPRFGARDFAQESPALERAPEELKSPQPQ